MNILSAHDNGILRVWNLNTGELNFKINSGLRLDLYKVLSNEKVITVLFNKITIWK